MTVSDYEIETADVVEDVAADAGPAPVVAVVGRPNVGKSTLVNRILGRREAVVEDVPGVTRDRVAYDATWSGRRFTVVDTGGWLPDAAGLAAAIAEQARLAVDLADVVMFVVDATVGATDVDEAVVEILRRSGKPVVLVANKVDDTGAEADAAMLWSLGIGEPHPVSALHGRGSGDLLDAVLEALPAEAPRETFGEQGGPSRIALLGRPNVGKSSLLNQLAGENRAVVDAVAGTTRWAAKSLTDSKNAPITPAGTIKAPGARTSRRHSCGAARATKPIGPAAAVAAAQSAVPPITSTSRVRSTGTPSALAASSPISIQPSVRPAMTVIGVSTASATAKGPTTFHPTPLRLPINHT